MKELFLILSLMLVALLALIMVMAYEDAQEPLEQTPVFCDRLKCRHTDCQYHPSKADGTHVIRTDLMWTMVCPHYRWTEDLDDPEG